MEQEQTWNDCKHSDSPKCKHGNEELIRELVSYIGEAKVDLLDDLRADPEPPTSAGLNSRMTEINEQFCNSCDDFQPWPPQNP